MSNDIRRLEAQLKEITADPRSDPGIRSIVISRLAWELRFVDPLRAEALCRQVQSLLAEHPHPEAQARYQATLADIFREQGNYQQALILADAATQLAEQLALDDLLLYLWVTSGATHWRLGNLSEALAMFQRQYRTARQQQDGKNEAHALNNIGLIYDDQGNYALACEMYERALERHVVLDDKRGQALVLNNLAMNLYQVDDDEPALTHALKSLELARLAGDQFLVLAVLDTVGLLYAKQGQYPQASTHFQQGLDLAETLAVKHSQAYASLRVGWLCTLQQQDTAAMPHLNKALQGFQEIDQKQELFECHHLLSEIYERQGDFSRAFQHYRQYHRINEQIHNEQTSRRLKNLQISHEAETLKQEAEINRLRNVALQAALDQVKQLSGLLPICANCKKIRDDTGYWHDVAIYLQEHLEAEFSPGICPNCMETLSSDD